MRAISFAFLALSCLLVTSTSPGSLIKISQNGIDQAIQSFIECVHKNINTFNMPDVSEKHVSVKDIVIGISGIDAKNTGIKLQPSGEIWVDVRGINIDANAHFKAKWSIFHTSGTIKATANDASLSIKLAVVNENGQPRIVNRGASADLGNLRVKVHGSIISWILDWLEKLFKGKIKHWVEKEIIKAVNSKIDHLSDRIVKIATQKALKGKLGGIYVGYGLSSDPSIADAALTIPTETQFWYKDKSNEGPAKSSGSYPFGAPSKMVCADIDTNLVFGTVSYAFNASDKSRIIIDSDIFKNLPAYIEEFFCCNCTSDRGCLTDYIPSLEEHCPDGGRIKIETTASIKEDLYFNDTGVFATVFSSGAFVAVAPDKTEALLFELEADVGAHLLQNITFNDWTMKGTMEVFYTKLAAKSPLIGDIDLEILDKIWHFVLKNIAEKIANDYLEYGLPLPQLPFITFSNANSFFSGPFLRFCTDVSVDFQKIL